MIWNELIEQAPAFGGLCVLVALGAHYMKRMTDDYVTAIRDYMGQIRKLSDSCHASHQRIAETMSTALNDNTESLSKLHDSQNQTMIAIVEMNTLLKHINGRPRG